MLPVAYNPFDSESLRSFQSKREDDDSFPLPFAFHLNKVYKEFYSDTGKPDSAATLTIFGSGLPPITPGKRRCTSSKLGSPFRNSKLEIPRLASKFLNYMKCIGFNPKAIIELFNRIRYTESLVLNFRLINLQLPVSLGEDAVITA